MTDCESTGGLMSLETALERFLASVDVVVAKHSVPLADALDHVLAEDLVAPGNVPPADNSAMDGYALQVGDTMPARWRVVGKAMAGAPFHGQLTVDSCVRIMTGAIIPAGANAVVMQENAESDGDHVAFTRAPRSGDNIRRAGEDIRKGDTVLRRGRCLSPTDLGVLASLGFGEVPVYQRLRVGLFSTGDELRPVGEPLDAGQIHDSNRVMIRAALQRLGYTVFDRGIVADDPQAIEQAFRDCAVDCDAIITSGGVSVGEADFTKDVLDRIGNIAFWKLALKPGKPFAFGTLGKACYFGLPGNPVSAAITFNILALPVLKKMAGEQPSAHAQLPATLPALLGAPVRKKPGRSEFQRGVVARTGNGLVVTPLANQGSGVLSSMVQANCYIILGRETGNLAAGVAVDIRLLPHALACDIG